MLLVGGILAVATMIPPAFPTQQPTTTTTTSGPQEQSAYITTTTNLGDATITEILVNTSIQFPVGNRTILPSSIWNAVQLSAVIIILCLCALTILLSLSAIRRA